MSNSVSEAHNGLKDHEIRELIDELRDIALVYHATEQLRSRIASAVLETLKPTLYPRTPARKAAQRTDLKGLVEAVQRDKRLRALEKLSSENRRLGLYDDQLTGDWSDGCGEGPAGEIDDDHTYENL